MKTLIKRYEIKAAMENVFAAMTSQYHIENWTGSIADFDPTPGGKFSMWDGDIIGRIVEISNNKIVQDWKEESWDSYTRVTLKLTEENDTTFVELIHKDIPNEFFSNISEGWDESYFQALKEYLEERILEDEE